MTQRVALPEVAAAYAAGAAAGRAVKCGDVFLGSMGTADAAGFVQGAPGRSTFLIGYSAGLDAHAVEVDGEGRITRIERCRPSIVYARDEA
jgi:hypothetical protein